MARQSILLLSEHAEWADRPFRWGDAFDAHRCSSAEEARALLTGSRPWALLLVDAAAQGADRDLIGLASRAGARPVVVAAPHVAVDWIGLGAHAILPADFGPGDLISVLGTETVAVPGPSRDHPLICVTGPGGTGASSVGIAISQGLAARPSHVLMADFRRNAELHVLHHVDGDGPGIGELVEAHRTSSPEPAALSNLPPFVPQGYRLLAGLRRAVGWSSLRPAALEAAIRSLRAAYDVVVCDVDPDLEGEAEGGSFDVEERNALSRIAIFNAAAVVVVGGPGVKGTHALLRVLGEMWSHGVPPQQTVAVINRGDHLSLDRLAAALDRLGAQATVKLSLPEVALEPLLLAGDPLPGGFVDPITAAVVPLLSAAPASPSSEPQRITPGSLGLGARRGTHD